MMDFIISGKINSDNTMTVHKKKRNFSDRQSNETEISQITLLKQPVGLSGNSCVMAAPSHGVTPQANVR